MNIKDIAGAVTASLVLAWGLYTEMRMQKLQRADELLKRQASDDKIVKSVDAESSTDVINDLNKITKG